MGLQDQPKHGSYVKRHFVFWVYFVGPLEPTEDMKCFKHSAGVKMCQESSEGSCLLPSLTIVKTDFKYCVPAGPILLMLKEEGREGGAEQNQSKLKLGFQHQKNRGAPYILYKKV